VSKIKKIVKILRNQDTHLSNCRNYREIALNNRKSIKRGIARFIYLNNIDIDWCDFETLVRRTQNSGYRSAINFLSIFYNTYSDEIMLSKKEFMYKFTIEYNIEMLLKQFPNKNRTIVNIINGIKTQSDNEEFKRDLYPIVKANKLQTDIIDLYA
jgi:hypothetical protein